MTPTNIGKLRAVVRRAWRSGFSVQSNFARRHAEFVALAASKQLITTRIEGEQYGRMWHVTTSGLAWFRSTEGQ